MSNSSIPGPIAMIRDLQRKIAAALMPLALLVARLVFGYSLYVAGRGKVGDDNAGPLWLFTEKLGFPESVLYITGYSEIILGWMIVFGLWTRFASAGVIVLMSVAMVTAHKSDLTSLDVLTADPMPFLAAALLIGACGAGWLSVDRAIDKFVFKADDEPVS